MQPDNQFITSISPLSRRQWLIVATAVIPQVGCGTIFWPERKGQPAGPLDPKVVILDALGLLLFFIPGVIAFAVDFNNGTIYLPPGEYASHRDSNERWRKVRTASQRPDSAEIEQLVQTHSGKEIRLRPGQYQAGKLKSAESLEDLNLDQSELMTVCEATEVRFRCQSH